MAGDQNKKVVIEEFEYKRQYKEVETADGRKYTDTSNYTSWITNIEVQVSKAEDIVHVNEDIKLFSQEVQDKFRGLFDERKNDITEGQIKFSYDATLSIMGELKNPDKITIIPAKAGFGKSSYIYSFLNTLCNHIKNNESSPFSKQGVIIVTDKIEALRQLENNIFNDLEYYHVGEYKTKYTYILEAWNKNSHKDGICKNESIEQYEYGMCSSNECPYYNNCKMSYQKKQQVYSPILLITNARFKQYQERIDEYKTWIDKDGNSHERNIVIIDEKPTIIDSYRIDTKLFSTLKETVEKIKNENMGFPSDKEYLLKEITVVENEVIELRSKLNGYRNCIYSGTREFIFSDEFKERWEMFVGYKHKDMLNAVEKMFTQGALWCNANVPYFKTLGIKSFNYNGFKTYIFDATAELDPDYDDDRFQFMNIKDYKDYKNVTFHIFRNKKMNMSRSALNLKKHLWKNEAVGKWVYNNFKEKTYVVTYLANAKVISKYLKLKPKDQENTFFLDPDEEKPIVPHFGDTKGSNEFKDARYMVQIGWNKAPSDEYLADSLSRNTNIDKLLEFREGKTERTGEHFENKNGHFLHYDNANLYMWRKMAVEFEQEVFRTCVRDFSADNKVDIYIFKPDKKVIGLISQRFKNCKIHTYNDVPDEFDEEKILGRKTEDGKDTKIQGFIKWLRDEWDGSLISIKDVKGKFEISDKYWEKVNSNQAVKQLKSKRNVKTKREGKGKNQINYWYIL